MAAALRDWLPDVLHFVEPWMSEYDIHAGQRWAPVVGAVLEETNFGILCVTAENRDAPWLVFEAGALSKVVSEAAVIPLLLDAAFTDISSGPLGQFQAKQLDRQGCLDVVAAINALSGNRIEAGRLVRIFERFWPDLAARLDEVPEAEATPPHRPIGDVLEELALGIQRIETRLDEVQIERPPRGPEAPPPPRERASPAEESAPAAPMVPLAIVRAAVERAIASTSLRSVARDVGMSPMGLRSFVTGTTPYPPTRRRLNDWYLRRRADPGPPETE